MKHDLKNDFYKCDRCNSNDFKIFEMPSSFHFKCCTCKDTFYIKKKDLTEIERQRIIKYILNDLELEKLNKNLNENLNTEINSNGSTYTDIKIKTDSLKDLKKELIEKGKPLRIICKERNIDLQYVLKVRRTIFDITISDDYFSDDYCPEEILMNMIYEEVDKGKIRSEKKILIKACDILKELGIIEDINRPHDKLMYSLMKRDWSIKKNQMDSKKEHKICNQIMAKMRKLKDGRIWNSVLSTYFGLTQRYINKLIDLINEAQPEKIINTQVITENVLGYRIIEEKLDEKELKQFEKRRKAIIEREEKNKEEENQKIREKEEQLKQEEEKKRIEEERIREIARLQKEEEERIRKREEELKVRKIKEEAEKKELEEKIKRRERRKIEWQQKIKYLNLNTILKILYNRNLINKKMLKTICNELNIVKRSKGAMDLITLIKGANFPIQNKIDVLIDKIPNFFEKIAKIEFKENYQPIPFSNDKEKAKKLLVEYLNGTYRYNPKTDLNKSNLIQKKLFEEPEKKSPQKDLPSFLDKEDKIIEEKKETEELVIITPENNEITEENNLQTIETKDNKEFEKFSEKLDNIFRNNEIEIDLDDLIQKIGYNKKKVINYLNKSELSAKYQINSIIKQVEYVKCKKASLGKVKRDLMLKQRMGIAQKKSEIVQLIQILEKKDIVEMSLLSQDLHLSDKDTKFLLKKLENFGNKKFIGYFFKDKELQIIKKTN